MRFYYLISETVEGRLLHGRVSLEIGFVKMVRTVPKNRRARFSDVQLWYDMLPV